MHLNTLAAEIKILAASFPSPDTENTTLNSAATAIGGLFLTLAYYGSIVVMSLALLLIAFGNKHSRKERLKWFLVAFAVFVVAQSLDILVPAADTLIQTPLDSIG